MAAIEWTQFNSVARMRWRVICRPMCVYFFASTLNYDDVQPSVGAVLTVGGRTKWLGCGEQQSWRRSAVNRTDIGPASRTDHFMSWVAGYLTPKQTSLDRRARHHLARSRSRARRWIDPTTTASLLGNRFRNRPRCRRRTDVTMRSVYIRSAYVRDCVVNPLIATLKPHSNGPSYSNTVIGTLAVDGRAVIFGTERKG